MARAAIGPEGVEHERSLVLGSFEAVVPKKGSTRDLTTRSLVQATGLSEVELLSILPALASEYGARVAATDSGEVLWRFPGHLEPVRPREGARFRAFRRVARRAVESLARAALALAYAPWAFFSWGVLSSRARGDAWTVDGRRMSFYEVVFSFVFGGAPDPEEARRGRGGADFLAWAATRGGLVSSAEYALREGLEPAEAERVVALRAAEYGGSPEALAPGHLAWRFPLPPGALPVLPPSTRRLPRRFSDNPPEWDAVAAGVGAAGLLTGSLVALSAGAALALEASGQGVPFPLAFLVGVFGLVSPGFTFWAFGVMPALAGFAGLAIPAARAIATAKENHRRARADALVRAGAALLELADVGEPVARFASRADSDAETADRSLRAAVETIAARFGAELDGEEGGWTVYRFPRLEEELSALRAARAERPPRPLPKGRVIFDSGRRLRGRKA